MISPARSVDCTETPSSYQSNRFSTTLFCRIRPSLCATLTPSLNPLSHPVSGRKKIIIYIFYGKEENWCDEKENERNLKVPSMHFKFGHNTPDAFKDEARRYILHKRGWLSRGFMLKEVDKAPDFVIHLRSSSYMRRKYAAHNHLKDLSVTDTRSHPAIIDIHAGNWESPPRKFLGTRAEYRAYLINHEVGHALGYGHEPLGNRDENGFCKLMSQQTRGTLGCRPNGFPN